MIPSSHRVEETTDAYRSPFAMSESDYTRFGLLMLETARDYLFSLNERSVYQTMPAHARALLRALPLPDVGSSPEEIVIFYQHHILPYGRGQQHPRFAAFVDPGATPISQFAAWMAATTNTSGSGGDYAMIYVEELTVNWLMELIGFPRQGSDGVLLSGGSDANRHCLEVARFWAAREHGWNVRTEGLWGYPRLTAYASGEQHSCIEKALSTLGIGSPRIVGTDDDFRMDLEGLQAAVALDRADGHLPFLVVASAGSVKTGAIDPLDALADFCEREKLWLHVDGAFGGLGAIDPRLQSLYKGIERAHSVALDPHKWLCEAIGCSCAIVREGQLLQDTFRLVPSYLSFQSEQGFAGTRWYSHRSAEQTRETGRALKTLWTIQQAGKTGLIRHVQHHIDLARYMEWLIEASPELELVASGPLTAVCFRAIPTEVGKADLNHFNQVVVERLQVEGKAFLAGVEIRNKSALRSCALHYSVSREDIEAIVREVRRVVQLCREERNGDRLVPTGRGKIV